VESLGLPFWLAIPCALYLLSVPGYFSFRLITKGQPQGIAPTKTLLLAEVVFWTLALSLMLCGWVALVLAELGLFSLWFLSAIVTVWVGVAAFFLKRRGQPIFPNFKLQLPKDIQNWLLIGLLAGTFGLNFYAPHQTILGGQDSGVYYNTGVNIARTGALVIDDPILPTLGEVRPGLLPQYLQGMPGKPDRYLYVQHQRNSGFYVENNKEGLTTGEVIPQFFHLYPAYLAVGASLFGVAGAGLVNPLLGVMGVFALYLLAWRLFPNQRWLAFAAALLLALNAIQVWFARHTMWEILGQFLILTALYGFTLISVSKSQVETRSYNNTGVLGAIGAGVALGMICLAHAQFPFMIWVLAVYFIWMRLTRRWNRVHWWLLAGFGVGFVHSVLHIRLFSLAYAEGIYHNVILDLLRQIIPVTIILSLVFFSLIFFDAIPIKVQAFESWVTKRWHWFALALCGIVVVYLLWSYFGRVYLLSTDGQGNYPEQFFSWESYIGGLTTEGPERMLLRLGWYFSPSGIVLVIVGAAFMFARMTKQTAMFLVLTTTLTVFFLDFSYTQELYIYSMRRYIPATLPLFSLLIAYACLVVLPELGDKVFGKVEYYRRQKLVTPTPTINLNKVNFLISFSRSALPLPLWERVGVRGKYHRFQEQIAFSLIEDKPGQATNTDTNTVPGSIKRRGRVGLITGVGLLAVIVGFMVWTGRTIFTLPQYGAAEGKPGMIKQLEEVAAKFQPNDLLIISGNFAVDHKFAAPLTYSYGRNTIVQNQAPVNEELPVILQKWRDKGYKIKLLLGPNGGRFAPNGYRLDYKGEYIFSLYQLDERPTQKPNNPQINRIRYELYDLVLDNTKVTNIGEGKVNNPQGWTLKIGEKDSAALTYGFYEVERYPDNKPYRWLEQFGVLRVPCLANNAKPVEITVTLDTGNRPDSLPPAGVSLVLSNNQYDYATAKLPALATFNLKAGINTYTFSLPSDYPTKQITCLAGASSLLLQIRTNAVWSPADFRLGNDYRKLGVKVLEVRLRNGE
jgi:hypothetical protein